MPGWRLRWIFGGKFVLPKEDMRCQFFAYLWLRCFGGLQVKIAMAVDSEKTSNYFMLHVSLCVWGANFLCLGQLATYPIFHEDVRCQMYRINTACAYALLQVSGAVAKPRLEIDA